MVIVLLKCAVALLLRMNELVMYSARGGIYSSVVVGGASCLCTVFVCASRKRLPNIFEGNVEGNVKLLGTTWRRR